MLPDKWCPQAVTQKPTGKGRTYTAANGSPIKDGGSKLVTVVTKDGQWHDLNFRCADVTRPLASVFKICHNGSSVVFNPPWHDDGSFIYNHESGVRTYMDEKDGVYVLETKIAPTRNQTAPSFGGQGQRRGNKPEQANRVQKGERVRLPSP